MDVQFIDDIVTEFGTYAPLLFFRMHSCFHLQEKSRAETDEIIEVFVGDRGKEDVKSDTESAGRYSRSEIDGASSRGQRKSRFNLSKLFGRNKDKVSGTDTDTMKTVITVGDEKIAEPAAQESRTNPPTSEGGIVYAELDLTQQGTTSRRLNEDKTEYAEILYTKPETEETADK
ncbi:hypothetical protein EAG_07252 [Camponotus floridanus]|uniref:Uncharacterized protein n=1 Tax=Camponotus floridanus TaxID=104421 RepID=E2AMP5_CAMFO|nr:hypothetical protein EAG_07252 [Camponotus floridanus]